MGVTSEILFEDEPSLFFSRFFFLSLLSQRSEWGGGGGGGEEKERKKKKKKKDKVSEIILISIAKKNPYFKFHCQGSHTKEFNNKQQQKRQLPVFICV